MTKTKTDLVGTSILKTAKVVVTKAEAPEDGDPGSFEALVSVFGNLDSQHDIVMPGAFTEAIAGGKTFPVLWSHQFSDDTAFIGECTAEETADGLLIKATFLETERAQNIRMLMTRGLVKEFSWSGKVLEGAWVETEDDWWYEIRKVEFWEAGPCFKGANPETELLEVKSGLERFISKEGRVLAQKHVDSLKSIRDTLDEVILAVEKSESDGNTIPLAPTDPQPLDPDAESESEQKASAPAGAFVIPTHLKALLALS